MVSRKIAKKYITTFDQSSKTVEKIWGKKLNSLAMDEPDYIRLLNEK